jgi:hypothetical protein
VNDPGGAVISGAQIQIQNINTGVKETVVSNASGVYSASQLPPGQYTVAVQKTGFQKSIQTGVVLAVSQVATLNVTLPVGDVKETVTVTANEELINVTTADISSVINGESVSELPLNGRDPSALVLLSPGTANIAHMNQSSVASNQGTNSLPGLEWFASGSGGRQGSTYYTLDGSSNMDNYLLTGLPAPNSDATQEFRVVTNGFDAQYGFSPAAVVLIQTKSGTNAFHGGAFEFIRNNDLNSADYFSKKVSGLKRNQFGGFVGGPIIKDKLFFFANYQDTRTNASVATNSSEFPTTAMLSGDFSAVSNINDNGPSLGFKTVGGIKNQIDPSLFSKAALNIVKNNMPTSSSQDLSTGLMYFTSPSQSIKYSENTDRIDYTFNDKQRLFLRSYILYFNQNGGDIPGNIQAVNDSQNGYDYNETLGDTWLINESTVNTLTAGYLQEDTLAQQKNQQKDGSNFCLSTYMKVSDPTGMCYLTFFGWGGGGSNWTEPISQRRSTWSLSDSLAKTMGNLMITSGVDVHKQFSEENTTYPSNGLVFGGSSFTGNGLADLLLGDLSSYQQGGGEVIALKGWQLGVYAQAQYKIRPNLTLSAGLRWDPDTPPASVGGRGSVFEPGAQSTMFPNAPAGLLFPGDQGVSSALMPTVKSIFEPRVGVAWQPSSLPHTSFRAGIGEFTGPIVYNYYNHAVDIAPFSPYYSVVSQFGAQNPDKSSIPTATVHVDDPWDAPAATGAPYSGTAQPDPFQSPNGAFASIGYKPSRNSKFGLPVNVQASFDPDFQPSMTTTWSFSIEHQLSSTLALHAAYVGSDTNHAMIDIDKNPGDTNPADTPTSTNCAKLNACFGSRYLYPNYSGILVDVSAGTSPYNSLQFGIDKKMSHGLQFQSNFTWSKVLDEASIGSVTVPNPINLRWNYGISPINIPFSSVTNFVYTTSALRNMNPLLRSVLGTWQISTIYSLQSGQPFGINAQGGNPSGSQQGGERADRVQGVATNVHSGSKSQWLKQYFNPAAFAPISSGSFGNSGKNLFHSVRLNYADSALSKNWKYFDHYGLQLRVDMFNTFNHTSFGVPDTGITDSSFGQITSSGAEPSRLMQGDLKFTF